MTDTVNNSMCMYLNKNADYTILSYHLDKDTSDYDDTVLFREINTNFSLDFQFPMKRKYVLTCTEQQSKDIVKYIQEWCKKMGSYASIKITGSSGLKSCFYVGSTDCLEDRCQQKLRLWAKI